MAGRLAEQEFAAHLWAPLDGPWAARARTQAAELWAACGVQLGMTEPIDGTGLPTALPADPAAGPEGALAGLQDPAVDFQVIARREHDVLSLSLLMAAPIAAPGRSRPPAAPGWAEFDRWWRALPAAGLDAMLGVAQIFQATTAEPDDARAVRDELPPRDNDGAAWWTHRHAVAPFSFWEVGAADDRAARRLVVLARPGDQDALSRFTWSDGGVALPPLARYLMHAAKLRYLSRVRGDGREVAGLRERADEVELAAALEALRSMRQGVRVARRNMTAVLAEPLRSDAMLGAWLGEQLPNDGEYLEATRERAVRVRAVAPPPARLDGRVQQRIGFGVDVVGYSGRGVPGQAVVQERLAAMVHRVLDRIELRLPDADHQEAGDGMTVLLPPDLELHRVLPDLLHGWRAAVAADNADHPQDRIRLRLSVAAGPFARGATGFTGNTIIEIGRLLDSAVLRRAVREHPDADLVALVAERAYEDVVAAGYPGLDAGHFAARKVQAKSYRRTARLWTGTLAV